MACLPNLLSHVDGRSRGANDGGPLPVPPGPISSISRPQRRPSLCPMLTNIMLSFADAEAPRYHVAYSLATFDVPPLPRAHPGTIFSASMYKHLYPDDTLSMTYVKRSYRTETLALTYVIVDEPVGRWTYSMFGTIVKGPG